MFASSSAVKGVSLFGYVLTAKMLILFTGGLALKIILAFVVVSEGYADERRAFLRRAERSLKRQWLEEQNPLEAEVRARSAIITDIRRLRSKAGRGWRSIDDWYAALRVLKASAVPLLEGGANATYDAIENAVLSVARFGKDFWDKLTREV